MKSIEQTHPSLKGKIHEITKSLIPLGVSKFPCNFVVEEDIQKHTLDKKFIKRVVKSDDWWRWFDKGKFDIKCSVKVLLKILGLEE